MLSLLFLFVLALFSSLCSSFTILFFSLFGLPIFRAINGVVRSNSLLIAHAISDLSASITQTIGYLDYFKATGNTVLVKELNIKSVSDISLFQFKTWLMSGLTRALQEPMAVIIIVSILYIEVNFYSTSIAALLVATVLMYRAVNSGIAVQANFQRAQEQSGSFYLVLNSLKTQKLEHSKKLKSLESNEIFIQLDNASID